MKLRVSLAFLTLAATTTASIAPVAQDDRCIGFDIDFSRIRSLSTNDIAMLMSETIDGSKTYSRSQVSRIQANGSSNQAAPPKCLGTRHRLQERVNGVPIYGADVIITINNCDNEQGDTNDSEYSLSEEGSLLTLFGRIPETAIQSIHGHQFSSINEPRGYVPTKTATEALSTMTNMLDIPTNAVGDLVLEVYVSTGGDFLAYLAYAIVEKGTSTELVHIVVDAHDLSLLSQCTLTSGRSEAYRQRHLRATKELFSAYSPQHAHRTLFNCKSCAEHISVLWFGNQTTCPIYSLYLDDPSHSTICTVGKNREDNSIVLGPGPVDELFWKGTLNCNGTTTCTSVVLPTCRDALSDVQFGGITTMTYLRDYLGYRGGLKEDSAFPVSVKAHAHYQDEYCNAFYSPATNSVYFGDCNCRTWSPLVSLDIIAHEIGHGVTQHSSNLVYSGQPGGLNEGFSDILGTTVEFIVNDANDQPDFTIAEQAGQVLRNMEYPIGRSLGSICEYTASLQVHFSSGALNKAFVKSIRACRASACDNLYGCTVLMGTSFLYSNIHGLTRTSTFLEGAEATCKLVDEFLTVRSPITRCTASQVKQFVREGWATVDVALSDDCVASETCVEPTAAPTKSPSASPSSLPSSATSETSSAAPSGTPSEVPSLEPSMIPSGAQSSNPSILPSLQPSAKVFQSGTREPSTPAIEGIESKEPGDTAPTTEQPLPVPSTLVPTTIEPATFNPTTFAPSTNEPTNPPSALFEPTQSANSPSSPIATVTRRPTQAPIATVAPRPTEAPIATVAPRPDRVPTRTQQEDDTPSSATNTTQEDVRGFCFAKFTNFFRRVITLDWV